MLLAIHIGLTVMRPDDVQLEHLLSGRYASILTQFFDILLLMVVTEIPDAQEINIMCVQRTVKGPS